MKANGVLGAEIYKYKHVNISHGSTLPNHDTMKPGYYKAQYNSWEVMKRCSNVELAVQYILPSNLSSRNDVFQAFSP